MIKTMIRKEARETLVLGVVGLLLFVAEVLLSIQGYNNQVSMALHNFSNAQYGVMQPIEGTSLCVFTGITCALLGAALGAMQAWNDRNRDLRAFLMHRPISRGKIFCAKIVAGLGMYLAASLPPLGLFVVWSAAPGNVAAPFQLEMFQPLVTGWLAGLACYFAAFIVQWRNARWYASRFLVALFPLLVLVTSMCPAWPYPITILVTLLEIAIMAMAARGSFLNLGEDEGMPQPARTALSIILLPGALILTAYAALLVSYLLQLEITPLQSSYLVTRDGKVYQLKRDQQQVRELQEVGDQPSPPSDSPENLAASLATNRAPVFYLWSDPLHRRPKDDFPPRVVNQFMRTDNRVWFYWQRYGRFVAYDLLTRQFSGSLGPAGAATNLLGQGDRFGSGKGKYEWPNGFQSFHDTNSLYRVNFRTLNTTAFYHADAGDEIVAKQDALAQVGFSAQATPIVASNVLVQTAKSLLLLDLDGHELWKLPLGAESNDMHEYELYYLATRGDYLLWTFPPHVLGQKFGQGPPIRVLRITGNQVVKEFTLPARGDDELLSQWFTSLMPAPTWGVLAWIQDRTWSWTIPWTPTFWSLAVAAVLWLPLGLFLGTRYQQSIGSRLFWAVFNLLFNLPGFLVFLSVNQWPARESCPSCKKMRVVNLDHCEHCQGGFSPAPKTGIEIFEPLTAK